jgi:uncharacterized protein DUF6265
MVMVTVMLGAMASAQERVTEHTIKPAPESRPPAATIADMAWLAGHWTRSALGGVGDEIWSPPRDGMMLGMYRQMNDGKPKFFELLTLIEEGGSLVLRLKHFNQDLTGWEEKNESLSFPLVAKSGRTMQFSGMTFQRDAKDALTVFLAIRQKDGTVKGETFRYRKVGSPSSTGTLR